MMTNNNAFNSNKYHLPGILFITSYPPRECGIATYSQDLIAALTNKFSNSFSISICPLESEQEKHEYGDKIKFVLNVDDPSGFTNLVAHINDDDGIQVVMIQHEFGFFEKKEEAFLQFLSSLTKPVSIVFHTVLPHPNDILKEHVRKISGLAESVVVMTKSSAKILNDNYGIEPCKISVIPHGTHLVPHSDKQFLKRKYNLEENTVLSTFGLLSSGKSIETTLEALPEVVKINPSVKFLIIGKTHPSVLKREGEKYRNMLEERVSALHLEKYVQFVNYFLPLPDLLEYLQLTDIYLFTSKDPNQAVSGTFSYAISCGCPIISTPIPHAREILNNDAGITFDFENPVQLSKVINSLLQNKELGKRIASNGLHRMASTAWENSAIAHAMLFEKLSDDRVLLRYNKPGINLAHIKKMTTGFGMIQFSELNHPDIGSGYTLDDNARALIAMCRHFELANDEASLKYITIYLKFIKYCQQANGNFLNYVNEKGQFTEQNNSVNLEDSNGRAIWALGYVRSLSHLLPQELIQEASAIMTNALQDVGKIYSTRAMAFVIKGLHLCIEREDVGDARQLIKVFADRLVQMYRHEKNNEWIWFESYLTYANSLLPEALLCAWLVTGETVYKEIAKTSFDFLLSKIFIGRGIQVISNKSWMHREDPAACKTYGGEQPIDVAYTILALKKFYDVFKEKSYHKKMEMAFNWFLGNNHLHQVIYNPCTGGCYDGLEENYVNLNQGAESTISYLLARLAMDKSHYVDIHDRQRIHKLEGYFMDPEDLIWSDHIDPHHRIN